MGSGGAPPGAAHSALSPFVFSPRVGTKQQIICLIHKITFLRPSGPVLGALCFRIRHHTGALQGTSPVVLKRTKGLGWGRHEKMAAPPSTVNMPSLCSLHSKGDHFHCSPSKRNLSSERVARYKGRAQNVRTSESPQFCLNKHIDWA